MAIKKTELYSSLWAGCDELRGGMDASQYKDYVLTLLFMKYVSDKYKGDPYGMIVVPHGASFDDMVALKGDKEIGENINKIISALAEENDLKGVIDVADFNDEDKLGKGKDMIDRLSKLIGIFEGLDLSANRADGDDLLGDAYEYLMRHFATESGKSKGQFYTPAEVSRILAKVIGISQDTPQDASVYDPTCGSGSLLLKASDEAPRGLTIFGQEMDNATSALARMNMILHNNATAKIWKGNTIADPQWKDANGKLKTFDFAVANPPFSNKNWTSGINPQQDEFDRFTWGIPPDKNGDYTFLLHIVKSLKSTGTRLPPFALREDGTKKGYKPSKLGEIPEDWDILKLGQIRKFKNGTNKDAASFGYGFPFVNLMDVFGKPTISSKSDLGLINSTELDRKEYGLKEGDILFIRSSVKPSGVGLTTVIQKDLEDTIYSGFLIRYRTGSQLSNEFKQHCFYEEGFRNRIIAGSTVSANTNINQDTLKEILLVFPRSTQEQTAIATILSDMDADIQTLQQRLSETRQIKQGMMQELLTGKIRLFKSAPKENANV